MKQALDVFLDHFGTLEDNREPHKVLHPVCEILLVTLCGVIAGADGWEDIEDYGASKLELLRTAFPAMIHCGGFSGPSTPRPFRRYSSPLYASCCRKRMRA